MAGPDAAAAASVAKWRGRDDGCRGDARQGLDLSLEVVRSRRKGRAPRNTPGVELNDEQTIRIEPEVHGIEAPKCPNKQQRAHEERHRGGDLGGNEQPLKGETTSGRRWRVFTERALRIEAGRVDRRHEAAPQRRYECRRR